MDAQKQPIKLVKVTRTSLPHTNENTIVVLRVEPLKTLGVVVIRY
jgi:hypothetical protein